MRRQGSVFPEGHTKRNIARVTTTKLEATSVSTSLVWVYPRLGCAKEIIESALVEFVSEPN